MQWISKNFVTIRDILLLIPSQNTFPPFRHTNSLDLDTFLSSFGSPFSENFSCAIMIALVMWIDSEHLPFISLWVWGSVRSYTVPDLVSEVDKGMLCVFMFLPFC